MPERGKDTLEDEAGSGNQKLTVGFKVRVSRNGKSRLRMITLYKRNYHNQESGGRGSRKRHMEEHK